jgi:hypothetical protein
MVTDVSHWIEVCRKQFAQSRIVLGRHKERFPSGSITRFVRLFCVLDKLALLDHRVKLAALILRNTCLKLAWLTSLADTHVPIAFDKSVRVLSPLLATWNMARRRTASF